MNLETLKDLYRDVLQDLYDAENQILKALPKMATAASSARLRNGFEGHLQQTQSHVERLNLVFEHLGKPAKRKKCRGVEGLLEEGKDLLESSSDPEILDAGLIAAAQKVEHYEIAAYSCARTYAEMLGQEAAAEWLQQTLDEEKETDEKLTQLAMSEINLESAQTMGETFL
jgi:ferritin-like metal-binding protein YciE